MATATTTANGQLDVTFAALADSTRRAILARLATGEATVNELAQPFSISLQAVSKHLKVLERAGLISRGRDAQWRPCRLEPAPLDDASTWIDENRHAWESRLDALGGVIDDLKRRRRA
jgi:DNA-binding transcriptional ArsR family regulator